MATRLFLVLVISGGLSLICQPAYGQLVPGRGTRIAEVGDDFEDESFAYTTNLPKASTNIDKQDRLPSGFSSNMRWFESTFRGTPDFVKRVETPAGGLEGSRGALALQTLNSGVPGAPSGKFQQDDLIANVAHVMGGIPVSRGPSIVTRVYLQPFDRWEKRTGSSFGFRADCQTTIDKPARNAAGLFRRAGGTRKEVENYWPGFFIQFNSKDDGQAEDSAMLLLRSGNRGEDIPGPQITKPGWWTLGLSFTGDGAVHFYAHEGIADLTEKDHLLTSFPYGYRCQQVNTFFFNVVNQDDGRTWSTRWIVDDPSMYVAR